MHRSIFSLALLLGTTLPTLSFAVDSALQVNDPYVRLVPPSAPASAAFMVISNSGSADRKLIKAESPAAKTVELHSHISENGVMKMRQVPGIDIKANARAELKPGSYHIMLIDMKQALKEGEVIPITLSFDDGSKMQINAPVRKQTTMPADKAMDHQGMKH